MCSASHRAWLLLVVGLFAPACADRESPAAHDGAVETSVADGIAPGDAASAVEASTRDAFVDQGGMDAVAWDASTDAAAPDASTDATALVDAAPSCTGVVPAGLSRETRGTITLPSSTVFRNADLTDYTKVYTGDPSMPVPWPGNGGSKPFLSSFRSMSGANVTYIALAFVPGDTTTSVNYYNVNSAASQAALGISECPGDFGGPATHQTANCSMDAFGDNGMSVTTDATVTTPVCHVVPGRTYYLNMMTATLADPHTSTCMAGITCQMQILVF